MVTKHADLSDYDEVALISELQRREEAKESKKRGDKIKSKIKSEKDFDSKMEESINEIISDHNNKFKYHRLPTIEISYGVMLDIIMFECNGETKIVKVVTKLKNSNLEVDVIS